MKQQHPSTRKPALRSVADRLRQIALYEVGGLILISPLFASAASLSATHSAALLAILAVIMATWNGAYTTGWDWAEGRLTGFSADHRPPLLRAAHAVMLEAGGIVATTPVIAAWAGVTWKTALLEDIGLTVAYAAYAFVFGLAYDSLFPIDSRNWIAEAING